MATYECKCGKVLELGEEPAGFEFSLVPEESIEEVAGYLEEGQPQAEPLFEILDAEARLVYLCPGCGRLHVQTHKGAIEFDVYTREVETPAIPANAKVKKP